MASLRKGIIGLAVLDSFARAEEPLGTANWAKPSWADDTGKCTVADGWRVTALFNEGKISAARWTPTKFKVSAGKYVVTSATREDEAGLNERWFALWACMDESAKTGYRLKCVRTDTDLYTLRLEKLAAGEVTLLKEITQIYIRRDDSLSIVVGGGKVQAFVANSNRVEVADSTYTEGYAGIEGSGEPSSFFDFKAGELSGTYSTILDGLEDIQLRDRFRDRTESPIGAGWGLMKPGIEKGKTDAGVPGTGGYTPISFFSAGSDAAYWTAESFDGSGGGMAAIAEVSRIANTSERQTGLWICRPTSAPETTESGYQLKVEKTAGANHKFQIIKWSAGTPSVIAEAEAAAIQTDLIGIAAGSGHVKAYVRARTGEWTEVCGTEDSTFDSGYAGVIARGVGEWRITYFQAGGFSFGEGGEEGGGGGPERVRHFDREAEEEVRCAIGDCDLPARTRTLCAVVRIEEELAEDGYGIFSIMENEAFTPFGGQLEINEDGRIAVSGSPGADISTDPIFTFDDHWKLVAVTYPASGSPTFYVYDFTTEEWSESGTTTENAGFKATGEDGLVVFGHATSRYLEGDMAAGAVFDSALSKADLEGLAAAAELIDWLAEEPNGLWLFYQASFTEALIDLTENGADEISRDGTTIVKEDPPIPYGISPEGVFVKIMVGGEVIDAQRWIMVEGTLVSA